MRPAHALCLVRSQMQRDGVKGGCALPGYPSASVVNVGAMVIEIKYVLQRLSLIHLQVV